MTSYNIYTFIVYIKGSSKKQWSCKAKREDDAWDMVYEKFPNAEYIDML